MPAWRPCPRTAGGLPLAQAALFEMVKIDLEKQWQRGRKPKMEAYLHFYPELGTRDAVPADLLLAEFQARAQAGDGTALEELASPLPRQTAELPPPGRSGDRVRHQRSPGRPENPPRQKDCPHQPLSPSRKPFGRYRIVRQLGEGGMATVYLAEDSQLGRQVALKVPKLGAGTTSATRARFTREARASATLNHPNICPVFDVGEVGGVPYLTMAFVEGKPLSHFLATANRCRRVTPSPSPQIGPRTREGAHPRRGPPRPEAVQRHDQPAQGAGHHGFRPGTLANRQIFA